MISALRNAAKAGELAGIDPVEVSVLLDDLMAEDWVVYAKPRLEHTESVITYLARYTHRIALSNSRILGSDGDNVHLRYRDGEHKTLVLTKNGRLYFAALLSSETPIPFLKSLSCTPRDQWAYRQYAR